VSREPGSRADDVSAFGECEELRTSVPVLRSEQVEARVKLLAAHTGVATRTSQGRQCHGCSSRAGQWRIGEVRRVP
jgi:hypothetical protein